MEQTHPTSTAPQPQRPQIVNISSPSRAPHRFSVIVSRQTTIHELKELIVTRLDTKPSVVCAADQRLIFGGHILEDKSKLDTIFDKVEDNDAPTIHLMVSHKHFPNTSAPIAPSPLRFRNSATASSSTSASSSTPLPMAPLVPTATVSVSSSSSSSGSATSGTAWSRNMNPQHKFSTMNYGLPQQHHHHQPPHLYYDLPSDLLMGTAPVGPLFTPQTMPIAMPQMHQPYQYVFVNGMPYLAPPSSLPLLQHQQMMHTVPVYAYDALLNIPIDPAQTSTNVDASVVGIGNTNQPVDPPVLPPLDAQEIAAREQRRAASLWLLFKLGFAVYLFSQNGSLERIVLLHIAALIIFLHQTGRLRIVRRIAQPPGEAPRDGAPGAPNLNNNNNANHANVPNVNGHTNAGPAPSAGAEPQSSSATSNSIMRAASSSSSTGVEGTGHSETQSSDIETSTSSLIGSSTSAGDNQQQQQQDQPPLPARVSRWRNIEHALLTFVTSLVPAPPPEIDPAVAAAAGERGM
ncbi:hypothetical protein BG004_004577 [Podila humilis]|nr:hypothetical protein BG004_004577 [Podila humilis]